MFAMRLTVLDGVRIGTGAAATFSLPPDSIFLRRLR